MADPSDIDRFLNERVDPSRWKPDVIETLQAVSSDYPDAAIVAALDLLDAPHGEQRSDVHRRISNAVSNYALYRRAELRPGTAYIRDQLQLLRDKAIELVKMNAELDEASRMALQDAAEVNPLRGSHGGGPMGTGEMDVHYAQQLIEILAEWCAEAIAAQPPAQRGQPKKEALLEFAKVLARLYSRATGQRPTRVVTSVPMNDHQEQALEMGRFRKFASIILRPLGASLSDGMAKEAIASVAEHG